MTTISTPPKYIPLPSSVVYATTVPAPLKTFFEAVYGLAWQSKYKFTPDLPIDELLKLLNVEQRTYQRYVQALERLTWLRSRTNRSGFVRFEFPERFPTPKERMTGAQLNDKNVVYATEMAYTTNLSFSRDDEDEEGIKTDDSASSSSSSKWQLLRAAGVIDAKRVMDDTTIAAEDVLAEVAYCYDPKNRVNKPDRLIGTNLLAGHKPSATYYTGFARFIPTEILAAAGIAQPSEEPEELPLETPAESQVNGNAATDPSLDQKVGNITPRVAWEATKGQLQQEMPKSTFDTWVRETKPLRWDAEKNLFVVGTPNAYSRDWLDGRLASTATRLLTGLLNQTVEVGFEVTS